MDIFPLSLVFAGGIWTMSGVSVLTSPDGFISAAFVGFATKRTLEARGLPGGGCWIFYLSRVCLVVVWISPSAFDFGPVSSRRLEPERLAGCVGTRASDCKWRWGVESGALGKPH